jgi:hypothetical protein
MRSSAIVLGVAGALVLLEGAAAADPAEDRATAFEATSHVAYAQPVALAARGASVGDAVGSGVSFGAAFGVRWTPSWSVLLGGTYDVAGRGPLLPQGAMARSLALQARGVLRVAPSADVDPWLSVGAGYRLLWESLSDASAHRGEEAVEAAIVLFGVDLKTSREVAIGPFVGAALDLFGWHSADAALANAGARGVDPAVYFMAGLALRLDLPYRSTSAPTARRAASEARTE